MKTYKLLGLIAAMVIGFASCETEVIDPAGNRAISAVTSFTDVNPAIFIDGALDDGYVQFTVNAEEGATFEEAYLVVSHNGTTQKKKLKDITKFGEPTKVTAVEAASALGMSVAEIKVLDYFVFEVQVKIGGVVYCSNGALTSKVVCPFSPSLAVGSYAATSNAWGESGDVTITADPEDEYTVFVTGLPDVLGSPDDGEPLVMHINPLNFAVTAEKALITSSFSGYDNLNFEGAGEYNSCDGTYVMRLAATVDQGSFGTIDFTFKRKD